jgi:hypothetical protein
MLTWRELILKEEYKPSLHTAVTRARTKHHQCTAKSEQAKNHAISCFNIQHLL